MFTNSSHYKQIKSKKRTESKPEVVKSDPFKSMSVEQLQDHIEQLQIEYTKRREYNHAMQHKLERTLTREQRLIADHQKELMQKETITMMTKYQLVFSQIECKFMKVLNTNKQRERKLMQRAFYRMVRNASIKVQQLKFKKFVIYSVLQTKLVKMVQAFSKINARRQQQTLTKWYATSQALKKFEQQKLQSNPKLTQLMQEQLRNQSILAQKKESFQQQLVLLQELKQKVGFSLQKQISTGEQVNLVAQLENENRQLDQALREVNDRLIGFVDDVNEFMNLNDRGVQQLVRPVHSLQHLDQATQLLIVGGTGNLDSL